MSAPRIAFICGSLRTGSINAMLEKDLMKRVKSTGAKASKIDLGAYDLPLFHGDLVTPPTVKKLIRRLKGFDGVVIVTPEYNGSLPPLLKNAIDWTTTVETGHLTGPVYAIAACTPGPMSGIMVMRQLNYILMRLGATVMPAQVGTGNAKSSFDKKGTLTAEPAQTLANKMITQLLTAIDQRSKDKSQ